jgi:putative endonuclease
MTKQQRTGQKGESLARQFFEIREYDILHTNWRCGQFELDIIATKNGVLHIIEVKTQDSGTAGWPEENVNRKKMLNLIKGAEIFMRSEQIWIRVQFDVLAIVLEGEEADYFLLEDVYL